ncbi:MAG: LPS export ABC transporter periplasmic protein LptC [Candidatus Rokubacteria bacterium]|nr:LPS export ABC transporter periplasmic protein LptC [Candidatus Rokubacteria bacterium]
MRRLAHVILAVVLVFVLVVAATLYTSTRAREVEPVVGPAPVKADLNVKEVRIEEEAGKVRWRLTAEQALMWDEKGAGRSELKRVSVEVDEPERSWSIVGDTAEYLQKEKRIELRGNVVVTSSDGLKLETDVLRWHGEERRLWTDSPVTLSAPGGVVRGQTLELAMASDATTIGGRVRARFERR